MGIYENCVLPRLLDLAMRSRRLEPYRERAVAGARGLVLEIGVGSGLNLALYRDPVSVLHAVDPSSALLRQACRRSGQARIPVSLTRASAERLPFADHVFDTIVMTWTLCSIPEPGAALGEIRRVLKPGGRFFLVEHGLAPQPRIAKWQHRLTPWWKRIGGGCHLDRDIDGLVRAAGFRLNRIETGYMKGPKPWTFMYEAMATT